MTRREIEDQANNYYAVIESRYILLLLNKIQELPPANRPCDYNKLRDVENLVNLMLSDAEAFNH